jgi:hypothetical protein
MLEVLLSVFVLSVGLMTIVAVINGSLDYSYETRDKIIATGLAQEGIELVRNVRDNNFSPIVAGGDGFPASNFDTSKEHCRVDWDDAVGNLNCQNNRGAASRYYLQYSGGLYSHVNAQRERYSRFIFIDYNDSGGNKRALVRSFVFWGEFSENRIPDTGNPANCGASPTCVYTETFLTAWN